ncbi:MAG: Sir2 family NAD-dependent protein deacetylase [Candidatus Malihini olakiniferum]
MVKQNIDNLHERAGSQRVMHMHGELLRCVAVISDRLSIERVILLPMNAVTAASFLRRCAHSVVWFGEIPLGMERIYQALGQADYFIAIGTSGHVYPAAGFVHEAHTHGAYTIELNLEPSQVES